MRHKRLGELIEAGLTRIKEDHQVYLSGDDETTLCGCALALALVGMYCDVENISRILKQIGPLNTPEQFAEHLNISAALATRVDNLHRVQRVSAIEIARRLKVGEI